MSYETRREIKRVTDKIAYQYWSDPTDAIVLSFCDVYDEFAEDRNISKSDRRRLLGLSRYGCLDVSQTKNSDDTPLTWHLHVCALSRACQLHSVSLFRSKDDVSRRQFIGRANRYHMWRDMLRFKQRGFFAYDLGGWYHGRADTKKLQINQFKETFGGRIVKNYYCERAMTLKGQLYLWSARHQWPLSFVRNIFDRRTQ